MVDDTVSMIRRRIDRVEPQRDVAGVDDVVLRPGRNDYCEARPDLRPNAIEHRFTNSLLHAEELIERVDFRADLFLGPQSHDHELAVLGGVEHPTEVRV